MYLKICGSIMIIAASAFIGYMYGERTKKEIDVMKSLLRCVMIIESEIRYAGTPVKEIFRIIAKTGELWNDFFCAGGQINWMVMDMTDMWDEIIDNQTVSRE